MTKNTNPVRLTLASVKQVKTGFRKDGVTPWTMWEYAVQEDSNRYKSFSNMASSIGIPKFYEVSVTDGRNVNPNTGQPYKDYEIVGYAETPKAAEASTKPGIGFSVTRAEFAALEARVAALESEREPGIGEY
jgi:hypothetical protein